MTTYNTGNPIGSSDPKDLFDNAQALDVAVNSEASAFTDRLGQTRKTYKGIEEDAAVFSAAAVAAAATATTKAGEAATSASNASTSAAEASGSKTDAAASATAASTSAGSAAASATTASASAATATTKASEAATSASNASTSAAEASGSKTDAAASATAASTSAGSAAASASAAATSATNAAASATAAEAAAQTAANALESTASNIQMDGVQSAGALSTSARGDHRHPTDTSRAPINSPRLTGTPTAPTAAPGTNTKQIANTEFVMTAASNAVAGVATTFASSAENASGTVENKAVDPLGIREAFNATGSAPVYACRAWVNFNGTGRVAIRASGNVSSITDNGTGNYTVNFATAMPDVNYSVTGSAMKSTSNYTAIFTAPANTDAGGARTTTSVTVGAVNPGISLSNDDAAYMSVAIFR